MTKRLKSLMKRIEALEGLRNPGEDHWCFYPAGVDLGPGERWVIDISVYRADGRLTYNVLHARVTSDPQDRGRVTILEDGEYEVLGSIEELRAEIDNCPSPEVLTHPELSESPSWHGRPNTGRLASRANADSDNSPRLDDEAARVDEPDEPV